MTADEARARLLEERERVVAALDYLHEENAGSLHEEAEEATIADNVGETATVTLDRQIDYSLEEASNHVLAAIDAALERIETGQTSLAGPGPDYAFRAGLSVRFGR